MKRISVFLFWSIAVFCVLGVFFFSAPVLAALKFPSYSNGIIGSLDTDGDARDVVIEGNSAYIADGNKGLKIMDISDPSSPTEAGAIDTEGYARSLFVSGSTAYIASDWSGICIVNVTDPAGPTETGSITSINGEGFDARDVFVSGGYIYVAAGWNSNVGGNWEWANGLLIFNASNNDYVSQYVAGGDARGVYVSEGYAYLAAGWEGGLKIVNVSNPAAPTLAGSVDTNGDARDVYVSGSYAYVADGWSGLAVIDINDPASPTTVAQESLNGFEASDVFVDGNLVYLSDQNTGGLKCFDIEDPANPKLRTLIGNSKSYGIFAGSGHVFLAAGDSGLQIIEMGASVEPKQVGYFTTNQTRDVFVSGNYAYVADGWDGFKIYDITDPAKPVRKSAISWNADVIGVAVSDTYAYLGCGDQGFKVVNVSDPNSPVVTGELSEAGFQYWDLLVSEDCAYVKGKKDDWANDGLIILDISTPTNPAVKGTLEIGSWFDRFDKAGNYLYLASGGSGLKVIDVSDPATPVDITSIGLNDTRDVAVQGNYAYVADGWGGLSVVDITDPTKPILSSELRVQHAESVAAIEGYVFILSDMAMYVFDTADPASPILVGSLEGNFQWGNRQIMAANDYLYLSGHDKGMRIMSPYPILAKEGEALGYTIPTTEGSSYDTFSLDQTSLDLGLSIDNNGVLSWSSPDNADVGLHKVVVTADSDSLTYHVWLKNLNQSPSITPPAATTLAWKHSALNSYQVEVTDDDLNAPGYTESFVYQVDSVSLAKGISIDTHGILKWKPGSDQVSKTVGDHTVTVTVTDKAGASASQDYTIKVFDFSQKMAQVSGTLSEQISNARDVKVSGDYAYVVGDNKLYILDADDLETQVGLMNDLWDAQGVDVLGNYAYVACGGNGIRIIDVSTPSDPQSKYDKDGQGYKPDDQTWYHYYNVSAGEKNGTTYVYAVGEKEGGNRFFEILNVSDPSAPTLIDEAVTSNWDWPAAVKVSGDYAYVAYGCDRLVIYDISDPASITLAGKLDGIGCIRDLAIDDTYAYLAAEWEGMRVVDISNPQSPELVATYNVSDTNVASDTSVRGIHKQGNYAYLVSQAGDQVSLDIVDVSSPSSPKTVETLKVDGTSNNRMGVDFSGNFVYAAFGSGGVRAFSPLTIIAEEGSEEFSFEIPVIGGSNFQLDADSLAAGMQIATVAGVGAVSWSDPDQKDDGTSLYELTITYKDNSNDDQTSNYFLWVQNVNTTPSVTDAAETLAWTYGVKNNYQVEVVDADLAVKGYNESFAYSVDNTSAGNGVFIDGNGLLTWNPASDDVGLHTITVTVQDKAGATSTQDFSVKVFNIKQVPTVVGRITEIIENARVVKVQGNYAYVLDNNSLRILDINDINNPVKVGSAPCNNPQDLALSGNYAYIADGCEGLRVVDVSVKTAPQTVATFKSMSEGQWCEYRCIAVSGNYAYLAGEREQQRVVDVVDISDPTAPSLVQTESSYEVSHQNNDTFQAIEVFGNYAYIAHGQNGLTILDLSNLADISKTGGLQNIGWSHDLVLDGNYVYMAADWDGLKVLDVSDPANPKVVGQFNPGDAWSQGIDVHGSYVYLASQTNQGGQLDIIDISDPYAPQGIDSIASDTDSFSQVDFADNYIYVAGGSGGVTVISPDAVQGKEGTKLSFEAPVIGGSSYAIDAASTAKGITIGAANGVVTWDAPANADVGVHQAVVSYVQGGVDKTLTYPVLVENLNQSPVIAEAESTLAWTLKVKNHFAIQVSDDDLNAPGYEESFTYQVDSDSSARGISVDSSGHIVWNPDEADVGEHTITVTVTDADGASTQQAFNVKVFDLSLSPVQVGLISEQLSNVRGLAVQGNYAYVLDNNRMNIYYVNNVNRPELVGSVPLNHNPSDIVVSGNYAYVVVDWGGLQIIDITNKSAPSALLSEVNSYYFKTGESNYQAIAVSNGYAYVAGWTQSGSDGYNMLEVIDVSSPDSPVSKDVYMFTGSNLESIKVSGNYVIAASGWEGLRAFDISDPASIQPAGAMQTNQHVYDLALDGKGYAYLANEWGGLKVIDISDPKDPSFAGGLGVSVNYNARSIDIYGNYAYLAGNKPEGAVLSIIDISNPLSPKLVNNLEIDTNQFFDQVDFTRAYAFVGNGSDGVRIISPQTVMGKEGEVLSFEIPVVNATDYGFALDGVSTQKGLAVDANGAVTWDSPANANVGLHEVKAILTDSSGNASKLSYQVWVENVNQAPVFAAETPGSLDWYWNVANTFKLPIEDDDLYAPGYKESFTYKIDVSQVTGDPKPEIDDNTGVVIWNPVYDQKSIDGYPVTITVADAVGEQAEKVITLKVKNPDVPFVVGYHVQDNAQEVQITGKPMVTALIKENEQVLPDWYKFTIDGNNKVSLSLSTEGQSDYLVELVSAQADVTLSDLLTDNKGLISGKALVKNVPDKTWTGQIEGGQGMFVEGNYLYSVMDDELIVYSISGSNPVQVGQVTFGAPPSGQQIAAKPYMFKGIHYKEGWSDWHFYEDSDGQFHEPGYGAFNFAWSIEDNMLNITITNITDEWSGDFDEEVNDVFTFAVQQFDADKGDLWLYDMEDKESLHLQNVNMAEGEPQLSFNERPKMSGNLIFVAGQQWDPDTEKDVTFKGAVDISNPTSPKWLGHINEGERRNRWAVSGEYIFAASDWEGDNAVHVYQASVAGITEVASLEDFTSGTQFQRLAAGDNTLLVKANNCENSNCSGVDEWGNPSNPCNCLFVYDLSDPASPNLVNIVQADNVNDLLVVSKGYAVLAKGDAIAAYSLQDLKTGSRIGEGENEIHSISEVTVSNYDTDKIQVAYPLIYLPDSSGNTFTIMQMTNKGQLKNLTSVEDKDYLQAVLPGGQSFLATSTQDLNQDTIYNIFEFEVQEGSWVYESFVVKSGTEQYWWEQQEAGDTFGYESVTVGLEPGSYNVRVSDAGGFDSTQKYALSCNVPGAFNINTETESVQLSETPSIFTDTIFSLLDTTDYLFTVDEELQAYMEFDNPSFASDFTLTLFDESMWSQEVFSLSAGQDLISSFNLSIGDYILTLENSTVVDALSDYTLSLSALEKDDVGEIEPNNDYSTANEYVLNEEFSGHIAQGADYDYYVLNLSRSRALDVDFSVLEAAAGSYRLDLILSGVVIDTMSVESGDYKQVAMALFPGRYYIRISGTGVDSKDTYSFTVAEVEGVDREFEPNNEKQFANSISPGTVKEGRLYGNGDVDWYAFHITQSGMFIFDFIGEGNSEETFNVEVRNIGGTAVMKFELDGDKSNSDMKGLYPGDYYIRINGNNVQTGKYTLEGVGNISELKELLALAISSEDDLSEIEKGKQLQLAVSANYSDGSVADISSSAEWKSLNPQVADVSINGLVEAVEGGAATITASYGDEETKKKTVSFTVNVSDPTVQTEKFAQTYGNLIMVAGGGVEASNKLANTTQALCDYVYMKFKGRGFEDEDIYYFNPVSYKDLDGNGFDDQIVDETGVTVDNFFAAIDAWATGYSTNGPLYIYLNDHGADDMFQLYPSQILTASQFATSLDIFQAGTGRDLVVVMEACHSGTFVDNLSAENRLVVTSSDEGISYLGHNGAASFSMFFMDALYKGSNVLNSYNDALLKLTELGKPYDMMNPQYNDPGSQLADLYVVGDFALAPMFAKIVEITIPANYGIGSGGLAIQAEVTGAEGGSVWATIKPQGYEPPPAVGDFDTPEIQFPTVTLVDEKDQQFDQVYEGTSDEFVVNGVYEIVIFAKDNEGNVTKSAIHQVTVTGGTDNQAPQAGFSYDLAQPQAYEEVTFTDTSTDDDGTIESWAWDFGDGEGSTEQNPTHTYYEEGTYTVTVTVTDDLGATNSYSAIITVGEISPNIYLEMNQGWNLLSSRIAFSVTDKLSDAAKFASVWKWENNKWAVYLPDGSTQTYADSKGFNVLSTVSPGEGFWVNSVGSETLSISGTPATGSLTLTSGWNLVGLKSDQSKTVAALISGNEGNIASVWKWDENKWAVYLPGQEDGGAAYAASKGFSVLEDINPGEGFWVNATQVLTLP